MTPSVIKPATFRLVAQCLNQLAVFVKNIKIVNVRLFINVPSSCLYDNNILFWKNKLTFHMLLELNTVYFVIVTKLNYVHNEEQSRGLSYLTTVK